MKGEILFEAMVKRHKLQFAYGTDVVTLEPYYLSTMSNGKKVVFGRVNNTNEIRMFEYDKIANVKVLRHSRFAPIIPIYYSMN